MFGEIIIKELNKPFHYFIPERLRDYARIGVRVLVPFRNRFMTGYLVGLVDSPESKYVKDVIEILDEKPLIDDRMLLFSKWVSTYYLSRYGMVLKKILPQDMNIEGRSLLRITGKGKNRFEKEDIGSPLQREVLSILHFTEKGMQRDQLTKKMGRDRLFSILSSLKKSGLIEEETGFIKRRIYPKRVSSLHLIDAKDGDIDCAAILFLSTYQQSAIDRIGAQIMDNRFSAFLLYGVTGSGKTEVYLRAVSKVIERKKGVILLTPEISLTSQLVLMARKRFGDRVGIFHSDLSKGERFDEWRRIKNREVDIVIGARSALFAPFDNLGMIIVDEEHDQGYKEENGVRYNARDMAIVRGKMSDAVVILGSATPSLESYYNCQIGKYICLYMPERIEKRPMPQVRLIDLRRRYGKIFSEELLEAMSDRFKKREQVLIFLNRRGFSVSILCEDCGYTFKCKNCDVSLIYHKDEERIICHYCGFSMPLPSVCPECNGYNLKDIGIGTQKVEEEIKGIFPDIVTARLDRDTTKKRMAHLKIFRKMQSGESMVLIGTQMITKGFDFPKVTLVGVLCADISLNISDFRASERTFQLLTQVAGRAGRGEISGEVIIQTYNPEHYTNIYAARHDFTGFYENEIRHRRELGYPPFSRLASITVKGSNKEKTERLAYILKEIITKYYKRDRIDFIGISKAPIARLKGKYRWHILIKGRDSQYIRDTIENSMDELKRSERLSGIAIDVDIDPQNMM
ncbi:MAG: primosomal protein N' [Nitrospirota bacterium]